MGDGSNFPNFWRLREARMFAGAAGTTPTYRLTDSLPPLPPLPTRNMEAQ